MCVCVSIFAAPCVSLYTTPIHHSSLSPLGQLITFSCSLTHIKKTSPFQTVWTDFILPRRPLSNIFFFLSPLWTQGSLHCPRSVKLSSALARVRVPGRVKLNSAALQWETLTGLHKTSGSERSLLKLSGNWFECWVHRQNNIDLWRFHIRGKSIFQFSRIKHYFSLPCPVLQQRLSGGGGGGSRAACYAVLARDAVNCVYVYLHKPLCTSN